MGDDIASVSIKSSRLNYNLNNITMGSVQSMILTDQLRDRLTVASHSHTPERKTVGMQLQKNQNSISINKQHAADDSMLSSAMKKSFSFPLNEEFG